MDERIAALDRRVAEAAEAWLADPRDTGVYTRLVQAIEARRAYLQPQLELEEPSRDDLVPEALQESEVLDDLSTGTVQPVGAMLRGDVRMVLAGLRDGRT